MPLGPKKKTKFYTRNWNSNTLEGLKVDLQSDDANHSYRESKMDEAIGKI